MEYPSKEYTCSWKSTVNLLKCVQCVLFMKVKRSGQFQTIRKILQFDQYQSRNQVKIIFIVKFISHRRKTHEPANAFVHHLYDDNGKSHLMS